METVLSYRGKNITNDDIAFIRELITQHPRDSRRALSLRLCHAWNWIQTNGHPRDMVCRGLLLALHRGGHLCLPPARNRCPGRRSVVGKRSTITVDTTPVSVPVKALKPLDITLVRRTPNERLYNDLVGRYHYLGYTQPVGEHLKYVIFSNGRPISCLAFGSSPRHIGCRDRFIGWDQQRRRANIHCLAYNTRFLILPWVRVGHLASHVLGAICRRISADWQARYHHPVYMLETFVDTERFAGTCYKAANWRYVGVTTGRGKNDQTGKPNRSIKAVWVYGLCTDFRERLRYVYE